MKKIAFIGMGNMAQALAIGMLRAGSVKKEDLYAYAPHQEKLRQNAARIGFTACKTPEEAIEKADVVFMACKPYQIEEVYAKIGGLLSEKTIINVAFGWDFEKAKPLLPEGAHYQYIIPNTPVSVGSGVILAEDRNSLSEEENVFVEELLGSVGEYMKLPLSLMGAANALAGCGPAFMAMIIEALGDGGVKNGLTRPQAYTLAARAMEGTAKMQLESGVHPGVLKDQVCSPGGVTIRGVAALEACGLRNALIQGIDATFIR